MGSNGYVSVAKSIVLLLLSLVLSTFCFSTAAAVSETTHISRREALGIGIGISIGGSPAPSGSQPCPPPPPPTTPCPPPPPPTTPCPPPPPPPSPPPPPPSPPPPSPPPPSPPPPSPPPPSPPPPSPPPPSPPPPSPPPPSPPPPSPPPPSPPPQSPPPPRRRPPPPSPPPPRRRPPPPSPPPPRPRPPPPRPLRPSDFENIYIYRAYVVIQRFKRTVTSDPQGITKTWRGKNVCGYKGYYCAIPPSRKVNRTVASVDFNTYQIGAPTIKGFTDQLSELALFHVNSNKFLGTVPDLSRLPYIYELDLSNNKLSGSFPAQVLRLPNATFLDLRFNRFAGPLPPEVFLLPDVEVLFLNNNLFNGSLPATLGYSKVVYLSLANNAFTGPIPRTIGLASNNLTEVLFLNNRLSGCLPFEIGFLKKATLFDAGNNTITGPIPLSFGCLLKLEQLNLAQNFLYGQVPDVLCRLATVGKLANLSLSENYFTSLGPSCWGLLYRRVLDVRRNCIPGFPDQRSPEECFWFLRLPKYCPFHPYIPCQLPPEEGVEAAALDSPASESEREAPTVADGGWDRAPAPTRFVTYSVLHDGVAP